MLDLLPIPSGHKANMAVALDSDSEKPPPDRSGKERHLDSVLTLSGFQKTSARASGNAQDEDIEISLRTSKAHTCRGSVL